MTLLTIVQDAANELGIPVPVSVANSLDDTTMTLLALANRGGKALAQRFAWQELTREWSLTAVAAESQGAVGTIMPGFNWDIYRTAWNRTGGSPIEGPLYPSEWQSSKGWRVSGARPSYRIRGGQLLCSPIPAAGSQLAGEYVSKYWCQSSAGVGQERWAMDTDTAVLSEDLLTLDLIWRFNRAKRLDYAEEKQEFEIQANNAMARNGSNRVIDMGDFDCDRPTGIYIPDGNW